MVFVQSKGNEMKLTDIRNSLNEISAIGGLKQVVKGNTDRVEGIKLSKEMAQAMIDWFNSSPYGRKYPNAKKGRLNLSLGIMGHFGLDRYAKHKGAKEELKYIKTLSKAMRDNVNEALNERAEPMLSDKEQEIVRKSLQRAVGVDVDSEPDDTRYHGGNSNFIFDGGEDLMLFVGKYEDEDKPYYVSIEGFDAGKVADEDAKDFKGIVKAAMKMAKKYKKRLTTESKSMKLTSTMNEGKYDGMLDVIEDLVSKASSFMDVGNQLKKHKVKYSFSTSMMPIYRLDKLPIAIVNKRYVDKADREVGDIAIGLMESMKMNEAKYDIGMARKGNGLTVYNKAEEENGDYKNVAHIDSKGKIKYYDKKVPSNIKKQIEAEAKKMMEITKEGTMKLKDILKESFEKGKVYSNPFHTPFVKENDEERREESSEMTTEQKQAFLEAVKAYKSFGETVYRNEGLSEVYESIRNVVESAGKNMVKETEGSFDGITVGRHVKRMNESFRIFEKTLREVGTLQQRLESTYDEIGEVLGKYYEINETEENVEEGNEFGANRAKAIANGDSEFEVDGKKYPVKDVSKDDKENAKEFTKESKSMKLTSMLNESFGYGELPSEKLMKMKVSAKDMLDSVKNKTTKKIVEGYSTEEKRIVLLAVRKLMKYKNIDINLAAQYVVGAAEELKYDIDKGRVKK
jgi:hypothetical protein